MTQAPYPYSPASVAPLPAHPAAFPSRAEWGRLRKDARLIASAYAQPLYGAEAPESIDPNGALQMALARCQPYLDALKPWQESHLPFLHAYRRAFPWTHEAHTQVGTRQVAILETFGVRNRQFALFAAARGYGMYHALVSDIYVAGDGIEGTKKAATILTLLETQKALLRTAERCQSLRSPVTASAAESLLQVKQ